MVAVGGTPPAPLFLFLAGISLALVTNKLTKRICRPIRSHAQPYGAARKFWGLGVLFRLQEYVIAWGWSPWSDLLRVDILNTIGLSMMLMGALVLDRTQAGFGIARTSRALEITAGGVALSDFSV